VWNYEDIDNFFIINGLKYAFMCVVLDVQVGSGSIKKMGRRSFLMLPRL
jgi:hypothetical protein